MTQAPAFPTETKAIFLQLTQLTRVTQDEPELSEKLDEVGPFTNYAPEIIICYHASMLNLEKESLF